jgi:hypothetical protein
LGARLSENDSLARQKTAEEDVMEDLNCKHEADIEMGEERREQEEEQDDRPLRK